MDKIRNKSAGQTTMNTWKVKFCPSEADKVKKLLLTVLWDAKTCLCGRVPESWDNCEF